MGKSVYLETTIISYLTARPTRDLILTARQQITRLWWDDRRTRFDLYISQLVLDEARGGDPDASRDRLRLLDGMEILDINEEAIQLGRALVEHGVLPRKAARDALHVAVAAVHCVDVLLTWNCRHLANAAILGEMYQRIRLLGYDPPVVCTPDELLGE